MSGVQSIERAFRLLEAVATAEAGVTELARRLDMPKSTVARLLGTLEHLGAVERPAGSGNYRLGPTIASLSGAAGGGTHLIALARPQLVSLASAVGEDAGLSVPDGFDVSYIDQVDSGNAVQVRDWTGTRIPMHAVPSGQVIMATWPDEMLSAYVGRPMERFTANTIIEEKALRARLRRLADDGYGWVREEFAEGINSVAAPVLDGQGLAHAAIHVHGPSYRFPEPGAEERIGALVVAAARWVSTRLG